ncbi:hypothetical protein PLIIFM63780_002164 [Purpureocillium lilacinum]|nr:hypothetical protein PLIIFM63780_002164 [Purpureocillium lilacinum]
MRSERNGQGKTPAERHHAMQECMKQGIHDVLSAEDKWPKELIFVGRNTRIVQGDDQCLGSPGKWVKWLGIGGGMEDEMEKRMKDVGQGFGIELQHEVFEG